MLSGYTVRIYQGHVGALDSYDLDWERCIREIDSYADDADINFSSLAKDYQMKNRTGEFPKNGG